MEINNDKQISDFYNTSMYLHESMRYKKYMSEYNIKSAGIQFCGEGILFDGKGNIKIGNYTYIGSYTRIISEKGTTVQIGNNVSISHRVSIYTINRKPKLVDIEDPEYEYECGSISIGDYSLIGINAVIMQGVNIGKNCFIGANSVVTHSIPENTVVAGNPARFVRTITE